MSVDYFEALQREDEALAAVKRLSAEIASVAAPVAHMGDGNCGAVLAEVLSALTAAGLYTDPRSRPRTPPRKQVIGQSLRTRVFERDSYRCVHCGTHIDLCVDHIKPESKGGGLDFDNLQTLCRSCNSIKGVKE